MARLGVVDGFRSDLVFGWACDMEKPEEPGAVALEVNGKPVRNRALRHHAGGPAGRWRREPAHGVPLRSAALPGARAQPLPGAVRWHEGHAAQRRAQTSSSRARCRRPAARPATSPPWPGTPRRTSPGCSHATPGRGAGAAGACARPLQLGHELPRAILHREPGRLAAITTTTTTSPSIFRCQIVARMSRCVRQGARQASCTAISARNPSNGSRR